MSIRLTFLSLMALCTVLSAHSQNLIRFNHTYGTFGYNYGMSVHQEADTGYVILTNVSGLNGQNNVQLFKIDKNGSYAWAELYSDTAIYRAEKMAPTPGGGYIICGYTNANSANGYDIFLLKTGPQGQKEWLRTYGGTDWELGADVKPTSDGGYVLCGSTYSFGNGQTDFYVIKTNASGDTLWTQTFGGIGADMAKGIGLCADGSILVTGSSNSFGQGDNDALLLKLDAGGNYVWHKLYGGTGDEVTYEVYELYNNALVLGGHTSSYGVGGDDYYLIYAAPDGQQQWHRADGGPDNERAYTLALTADSGYVLSGHSAGPGYDDVYFYKMKANGDWHYSTSHGSVYPDYASCIRQTLDGGYIIVGSTAGFGNALSLVYVIKTGPDGLSAPYNSINESTEANSFLKAYPNPASSSITIETPEDGLLEIVNLQGQNVLHTRIQQGQTVVDISQLATGMYFIKLQSEGRVDVRRFLRK